MIANRTFFLVIGIFWKIFSCFCFALINILVRFLSGGSNIEIEYPLSIYNIMFFQNLIVVIVLIPFFLFKEFNTKYALLHSFRIFFASLGMFFFYLSLKFMPITKVIILNFFGPALTIFISNIFIKEKITLRKIFVFFIMFVGIFLVINFKDIVFLNLNYFFYPLISSFFFAFDKIFSKRIMVLENNSILLGFYLFLFTIPFYFILVILNGINNFNICNFIFLFFLSVLTILAHYSFNKAFFYIEVMILVPYGVSKFIISALAEYLIFNDDLKVFGLFIGFAVLFFSVFLL